MRSKVDQWEETSAREELVRPYLKNNILRKELSADPEVQACMNTVV
jgi:hypothetical protein